MNLGDGVHEASGGRKSIGSGRFDVLAGATLVSKASK